MSPGLPEYRVAVVVFVTARGVDYADAGDTATRAVRRALHAAMETDPEGRIPVGPVPHPSRAGETVELARVAELGLAMANGYIGVLPAIAPWQQRGVAFPPHPRVEEHNSYGGGS